jgi:ERCC4-type nuclease
MAPKAVLSSIWAFEARYRLPVVFASSPEEAAALVERWAYWHAREALKRAERVRGSAAPAEPVPTP